MERIHTGQVQLKAELEQAQDKVEIGAQYRHYKAAHNTYTVLNLAFQEEDNELCVIYRADYEEKLTFVRPLVSWLAMVEWQGETVPRFTKL
ncbi:MAG TPA: DUF1653 domain-containing protein [Candidatus Saccharimonadales bacterium]